MVFGRDLRDVRRTARGGTRPDAPEPPSVRVPLLPETPTRPPGGRRLGCIAALRTAW